METSIHNRVASLELEIPLQRLIVVVGCGTHSAQPLKAALVGGLASALITDEATASELLGL